MRGKEILVNLGLPLVITGCQRHLLHVEELQDVGRGGKPEARVAVSPPCDGEGAAVGDLKVRQTDGLNVVSELDSTGQD